MTKKRETIYCDCCGREGLAYRYLDGRVVVVAQRHGERHVVTLPLDMHPKPVQESQVITK